MPRHQRDIELEQFWRRHLAQQGGSGGSVRGYCRLHGLKEYSFYSWRNGIAARDRQASAKQIAAPSFLPVAVVDAPARRDDPPLEIRLGGRRSVRVHNGCDRRLLADVLAILLNPATEASSC